MNPAPSAPRVIVLNGEPFTTRSATGITLSNLFAGWPAESLYQIYSADIVSEAAIAGTSRRISNSDLRLLGPFFGKSKPSGSGEDGSVHGGPGTAPSGLRRTAVALVDLFSYRFDKPLLRELHAFRPNLIYSLLGNIRLVTAAEHLSRALDIPVVPHFMDDWISTYSVPGKSSGSVLNHFVLERRFSKLMRRVPLGLAIGDAMADEYAARFDRPFEPFMNPVDVPDHPVKSSASFAAAAPLRFVYAGGLHLGRNDCLLAFARALSLLRARGRNVEFAIFAPPHDIAADGPRLRAEGAICESLTFDEIRAALSRFDIAVHVESLDPAAQRYTRLSVSTKIPQYMAAGLPIFGLGPTQVASCRYVSETGSGIVTDVTAPEDLAVLIEGFAADAPRLHDMANAGRTNALARHDQETERGRFRAILAAVGEGKFAR